MLADNPSLYINRELSWIRFNRHVLDEARDTSHPLLERVKFLAIFANNLDEFFMIRVSGLQRQLAKGVLKSPPDGMTPAQQLDAIRQMLIPELDAQYDAGRGDPAEARCCRYPYPYVCGSFGYAESSNAHILCQ